MKFRLIIQSLSPLALLTIIRNFSFSIIDSNNHVYNLKEFLIVNRILVLVIGFCCIWLALSITFYIKFMAFQRCESNSGYIIENVKENKEASLNFFMTLIVPLLIDDVQRIQGALTFAVIVAMMCVLLYKTNLFYANPVLAVLGYRIYSFTFQSNCEFGKKEYVCITREKLSDCDSVKYKKIQDGVFCLRV